MSEAQNTANKANAQLSTGPNTEAGKAISSMNAVKHGLTAKTVLLPGEDAAAYEALAASMLRNYDPLTTVEATLATELIDIQWRLQRVSRSEARILAADAPDFKALNYVSLHASRMKRQFSATLKELQHLHRTNTNYLNEQLKIAETIYKADLILERPSSLAVHGFDFTVDFLKSKLRRKKAFDEAQKAIEDYEYGPEEGVDDDDEDELEDELDLELDDAA